ncbi:MULTISPECIES: CpaF family protein [Nocardiopsis]|uniref:Flp pilus assembly CpaF family ATPase n=1 Tax=Nocardiopsis metallicus TaxID=179819 RepID=A0A840WKA3_9ACTN|nr:Flp pilus assembly CpaF family ATPase [Nocardiopsis metallicus]
MTEDTARQVHEVAAEVTKRLSTAASDTDRGPAAGEEYRALARRVIRQVLDERASRALVAGQRVPDRVVEETIARQVLARVGGLGPLEELLAEEDIENINLTGRNVWVRYADGRREQRPPIVDTAEELVTLVRRIAADSPAGERRFDPAAPILDMVLPDGSRLNAILDVSHLPVVSIRRHRYRTTGLGQLRRLGTLDPVSVDLLRAAVRARRNIVITGGTGAGKTTLLRALAAEIPPEERIVTIEDVPELGLERDVDAHPDAVALHARPANTEGQGEVTVADLVRAALRMSPDRVIVGETRGSETVPLLTAMSQGNDGSLTTLHAPDSQGAFTKFGAYAALADGLPLEATSLLVAAAVHLVVHVSATPAGERRVTSVREVVGADGRQVVSNEIYSLGGRCAPPGPTTAAALQQAGFDVARLVVAGAVNGSRRAAR